METVCTNCKYHRHIIKNPAAPEVWYNHFCGASELSEEKDPVTGKVGFVAHNDLGAKYFSDVQFDYCRNVNKGNCHLFEVAEL